ncbi:hypothetical protein XENOCAPTIV_003737 [Xenoophorus captivus]|uniref:Uncharacterized protein n=1 Tax=Xenoophorus captivus TaxID=1517983 RepID=A0ABV0R7Z5_9TELE
MSFHVCLCFRLSCSSRPSEGRCLPHISPVLFKESCPLCWPPLPWACLSNNWMHYVDFVCWTYFLFFFMYFIDTNMTKRTKTGQPQRTASVAPVSELKVNIQSAVT